MKKSPVYPNFETSDYGGGYEFDPQVDFTQFLEEARQHAREMNRQTSQQQAEEGEKSNKGEVKKSRKSWKTSLFNFKWWKSDNKKTSEEARKEQEGRSRISNPRKGHVSGPIYGSGGISMETKHKRQTSGPLTNLFNSSKRAGNEIPYMCLDQLNCPHAVKAYGPVYLVT